MPLVDADGMNGDLLEQIGHYLRELVCAKPPFFSMIPGPDGPNTGPPLVFQGAISIQGSKNSSVSSYSPNGSSTTGFTFKKSENRAPRIV
jgi:hypothetical protein